MEIHEELGLGGITPFDSLFSPDGHFKPKLRNTVRDALVQSRFDNVASVLQDESWIDSQHGPFEGPPAPGLGVSKKQDLSRPFTNDHFFFSDFPYSYFLLVLSTANR